MCALTHQCHMPKPASSNLSLDMQQAQNTSFVHQSTVVVNRLPTDTQQRQRKERALSIGVGCLTAATSPIFGMFGLSYLEIRAPGCYNKGQLLVLRCNGEPHVVKEGTKKSA